MKFVKDGCARIFQGLPAVALAGAAVLVVPAGTAEAAPPRTIRVSVSSTGVPGNADSFADEISADGRYVLFTSYATNLVPGDTNRMPDAFVRDLTAGTTTRVSVTSTGGQGNGATDGPLVLSPDGRHLGYRSESTNLVPGDTNGVDDVFVRDRRTNTLRRVSVSSGGAQGNGHSVPTAISADGRYVLFDSDATNLVPGDSNEQTDTFLHDVRAGTTRRVSVTDGGAQQDRPVGVSAMSADGRYVVFDSAAANLVADDTNRAADIFVRDVRAGTTRRVSLTGTGAQPNGDSGVPTISADGRYVGFFSYATNLVPGDTNGAADIFVRDVRAGTTRRVSVASTGVQADGHSLSPTLTADGRHVAFGSNAANLVPGGVAQANLFLRDQRANVVRQITLSHTGGQPDTNHHGPVDLSADGRIAFFSSNASNLVAGHPTRHFDAYVRHL